MLICSQSTGTFHIDDQNHDRVIEMSFEIIVPDPYMYFLIICPKPPLLVRIMYLYFSVKRRVALFLWVYI